MKRGSTTAAFVGAAALLLTAGVGSVAAQTAAIAPIVAQFMDARGVSVEVLGLQRWTPTMLRDSLKQRAPGQSMMHRKFPSVLREKLGFRDAFVARVPGDSAVNLLIAVVEPGDATRGQRRLLVSDTASGRAPWTDLIQIVRQQPYVLPAGLRLAYARSVGLPPVVPLENRPDSIKVRHLWTVLEAHRALNDAETARRLLTSSPNVYDRVSAVAILANLEQDDAAWRALVGALLDPDERVTAAAESALRSLVRDAPRSVDWRPAEAELRAIVNGAAIAAVPTVLDVLLATRIDPALGARLLSDGGLGVRVFAGATTAPMRRSAYRFLRAASRMPGGLPDGWRFIANGSQS